MNWYCKRCKRIHSESELCQHIQIQLKEHPEWLTAIVNFSTVAGEERLVTTQTLDVAAKQINEISGTQLTYEGTQQYARDIQVFQRIHLEKKLGAETFNNVESASDYASEALSDLLWEGKTGKFDNIERQFTGYSQEVDWLRVKQGKLMAIFQKSTLLDNNAPGVDGVTINRFTGEQISRTTIKASKNTMTANGTGIKGVKKAIAKGTANEQDIIFGPEGTKLAAREAGLTNPVEELHNPAQIQQSNERLRDKMLNNQGNTAVTMQQVGAKMVQGAVVGAAVSVTISSITNYIRYKNNEITRDEAFREISEDAAKGLLVGAALGATTIFLPCGVIGFLGGIAIGTYFSKSCSNILDEIYGKGAYGEIMNASGYVYGMTFNLADYYRKIEENNKAAKMNVKQASEEQERIDDNFALFDKMRGEL